MIFVSVYMMSGELICETRVREFDLYTVWDLKCLVGHRAGVDPLMVGLLQGQLPDLLDDKLIVTRLPTACQMRQLSFTAVLGQTKAYRHDQLLLQGDSVSDDASWPSLDTSILDDMVEERSCWKRRNLDEQ